MTERQLLPVHKNKILFITALLSHLYDKKMTNATHIGSTNNNQTSRSTIIFLISEIALAGERPFGHALAQFMMV